jgi:hypothetical protein
VSEPGLVILVLAFVISVILILAGWGGGIILFGATMILIVSVGYYFSHSRSRRTWKEATYGERHMAKAERRLTRKSERGPGGVMGVELTDLVEEAQVE